MALENEEVDEIDDIVEHYQIVERKLWEQRYINNSIQCTTLCITVIDLLITEYYILSDTALTHIYFSTKMKQV